MKTTSCDGFHKYKKLNRAKAEIQKIIIQKLKTRLPMLCTPEIKNILRSNQVDYSVPKENLKKQKKHQNYIIIAYICRINKNIELISIYFHKKVEFACYARTVN
ncbi:hypothetical protein ACWGOQ_0023600 [Aquimarina sp. M1]